MSRRRGDPPPNYDYTTARRQAAARARAADRLDVQLGSEHAAALAAILDRTGETRADCVRRLILAEAGTLAAAGGTD